MTGSRCLETLPCLETLLPCACSDTMLLAELAGRLAGYISRTDMAPALLASLEAYISTAE